jgi:hypothetical protein
MTSFERNVPDYALGKAHGMSLLRNEIERTEHPVDFVERLAASHKWSFDRDEEDEISILVSGGWTDYTVAFTWLPEIEALHLACAFDLKVPVARRTEVLTLLSLINEQLWVGHFDIWAKDGVIMFRHSLLLAGGTEPSGPQCEAALTNAVTACERYYQAFQFVIWAGKNGRQALEASMFETKGHA